MATMNRSNPRIAIVGAGLSGLRCATILLEQGFDVTIFEARHEIGGRTRQLELNGHRVDIGANWIHGYNEENPIAEIQKKIGTVVYNFDRTSIRFDEQGKLLTEKEALADAKLVWPAFERMMKYSALNYKTIDPSLSWQDRLEVELKETIDDPVRIKRLLRALERAGAFPGEGIDELSFRYAFMEDFTDALEDKDSSSASDTSESDEPDNVFVASTYHDIVQHIAKLPLEKATLHLNTEVTAITNLKSTSAHLQLQTKTGKTHHFDDIIVTTPLGWLKKHNSIIQPSLPQPILAAIADLSFGRLEKCYISFPRAFWHDEPVSPANLLNISITNEMAASTLDSQPTSSKLWSEATFLSPAYHPYHNPNSGSWPFEGLAMCMLPAGLDHPTLLLYHFGDAGAKISSLLAKVPPTDQEERDRILKFFYEPFYSRLPGYDAARTDCRPVGFVQTMHQLDPLQLGSYTCSTTRSRDTLDSLAVLSGGENGEKEGVMQSMGRERGVWLAGEHCAGETWVATTVGAYVSGERVGKWIVSKYRN